MPLLWVGHVAVAPQGDVTEEGVPGRSTAWRTVNPVEPWVLCYLAAAASCSSELLEKKQVPACCCHSLSLCEAGMKSHTSR